MEREELPAVHDSDLSDVLAKLGILASLEEGDLRCALCGEPVSTESIGCIFVRDGCVQICCESAHCIRRVTRARAEENRNG